MKLIIDRPDAGVAQWEIDGHDLGVVVDAAHNPAGPIGAVGNTRDLTADQARALAAALTAAVVWLEQNGDTAVNSVHNEPFPDADECRVCSGGSGCCMSPRQDVLDLIEEVGDAS